MNKNNINSLYELIKQKSQEKGRKLKIICDWDECIIPVRPTLIWNFTKKDVPFNEYFSTFWERAKTECSALRNKFIGLENANEEEKKATEKFKNYKEEKLQGSPEWEKKSNHFESIYNSHNEYCSPFLSIAEQLLKALKEDLIEELHVISINSRMGKGYQEKTKRFNATFGQFPNAKIKVFIIPREKGKSRTDRWRLISDYYPQFDLFIDDNYYYIDSARKNLSPDKLYVLPDYKTNRNTTGSNIYHLKTSVSDVKDQDFVIAALELKTKQLEQELTTTKAERERETKIYWMVGIGIILVFGITILSLIWFRRKKKQN